MLSQAYQMEYNNVASGKIVSATKRRISWRFGFPNAEAVKKGLNGVDCRGSEHEVTLIWSLTSSKREIKVDGNRVHYSVGNLSDIKFEESWKMANGHELKIIAHAAPPMSPRFNGNETAVASRQYDLLIDGFSFFDIPYISNFGMTMNTMDPYNRPIERRENHSKRSYPNNENKAQPAMASRRVSSGSVTSHGSNAWPTPVSQHINQAAAMASRRVSSGSVTSHGSNAWPTPVSQHINQAPAPAQAFDNSNGFFFATPAPTVTQNSPISQPEVSQSNYGFQSQENMINQAPAPAFDNSNGFFFAPPVPTVTQNSPPISQPQVSQSNYGFQSQENTIASNSPFVPVQPSAPAYFLPDSATSNVAQDKGMHCSTPQSNIDSSQCIPYSQDPRQNPYVLPAGVMHNNGVNRAY